MVKDEKEKDIVHKSYVNAQENRGKEQIGGVILNSIVDLTHPLGFGYEDSSVPVYKNNSVWLSPSKNEYSSVVRYSKDALIDGFMTEKNKEKLEKSVSLVVSKVGRGIAILFADNPNFRGSWYGTNRLFLNAIFLRSRNSYFMYNCRSLLWIFSTLGSFTLNNCYNSSARNGS